MYIQGQAMQNAPAMRSTVTLAELMDRARPLLIFAPDAKDMQLMDQIAIVQAHSKGAKTHSLLPVAIPESGEVSVGKMLNPEAAAEARRRFHVAPGEFAVVLLGKDGREKLRSSKPLPFQRLKNVMDGKPAGKEKKDKGL
jgi:hypothetical protein